MFSFGTMTMLFTQLPAIVSAIEAILSSGEAKTVEDAISALINHITPGKPNSTTLTAEAAPPA